MASMKMIAIPFLTRHYLAKGHNLEQEIRELEKTADAVTAECGN